MTATLNPTSPHLLPGTASPAIRVTLPRVLRSEWTKFISLRSTIYTLAAAAVLSVGIGALICAVTASQWATLPADEKAGFSAVGASLQGTMFAQVAVGVLGVLLICGEYSTGMIRSSLTAVPQRLPVLWTKLVVSAAAVLLVTTISSFVAFFLGQALLHSHQLDAAISAPGALRSVFGAALYLTVAAMIALALGALFRNTAAGISTFAGVFFVLPLLTKLLPVSWSSHFAQYLPSNAGGVLYGGTNGLTNQLAPWTGFAVLCGYAAALIALAAWRLRRTDA